MHSWHERLFLWGGIDRPDDKSTRLTGIFLVIRRGWLDLDMPDWVVDLPWWLFGTIRWLFLFILWPCRPWPDSNRHYGSQVSAWCTPEMLPRLRNATAESRKTLQWHYEPCNGLNVEFKVLYRTSWVSTHRVLDRSRQSQAYNRTKTSQSWAPSWSLPMLIDQ